ncbi:DUF190 domain-containing protein [Singulisphaera acidiphila]|uniref:PII-like signaling protein n=1 Tax=Singulisphaera acidiphila (strain ATCC BAA-1392 / DSM 18658 / VKM B-2454 / MOB10) TaxID=886293 RepID=L0DHF8_SINAD|nr:DUF190 domain-containing protein [Singulisphaera acidiphila]AGA28106.1 hypothetical protein Sinac_3877 [Singulisphaera acidiphila DSM 18658]
MIPQEASLLRIYLNANEYWHGKPLYQVVIKTARARHLAGASVFLVEMSYGAHHQVHDVASEYASFELPVVIEVVDAPERVEEFLRLELESTVSEGLITVAPVRVLRYPGTQKDGAHSPSESVGDMPSLRDQNPSTRGTTTMRIEGEAQRVTVYIGNSDTWHGRNLALTIVERCREMGMAGATASRGVMGFGGHSIIHRAHLFGLSEDVPERVEVVDRPEKIAELLPVLDEMVGGGLIVLEEVRVIRYLHDPKTKK